jgi:hypothetical protein
MVAINICFILKNSLNNKITNINEYLNSFVKFDETHIPHITLLQFYTEEKNVIKIKNKLKEIKYNFNKVIINNEDLEIIKYEDKNIYSLKINSIQLKAFQKKIFKNFKSFIYPSKNNSEEFIENINYTVLKDIVNNYYLNEYYPHITLSVCKDIKKIIFDKILIENKDIELGAFYIGDYGSAIPIN